MEEIKYSGRLSEIIEKEVESNGKTFKAEMTRRPPGVRVVILKEGKVLLTKEYRHEIHGFDFRLPGGKVFDSLSEYKTALGTGENIDVLAKEAALKEAREEAGIEGGNAVFIHKSVCGAAVWWDLFYFAITDFTEAEQQLGDAEDIKVEWMESAQAKEMCLNGQIGEERSALILLRYLDGRFS